MTIIHTWKPWNEFMEITRQLKLGKFVTTRMFQKKYDKFYLTKSRGRS
jgi:hypothetical protein